MNTIPDSWPFPIELMEGQFEDQRAVSAPLEQLATPVTKRKAAISKCGTLAQRTGRPPLTDIPDAPY